MIEFEKPRIEKIDENRDYGKFVVEPLERGYGTTLGNSLRRILLSSLPGAAITNIQIDGVLHEFSTIPGVREDVTQIILNIKGLALKLYAEEEKTLEIDITGPATVTAGDIIVDSDVEILNKDLVICSVAEGATFHARLTVKPGRGYVQADENKKEDMPIGVLPVDSIYTPVRRVNYQVENTGKEEMYFGIGGHPAFNVPLESSLTFEDYYLSFSPKKSRTQIPLAGPFIDLANKTLAQTNISFDLTHQLFENDAMIFETKGQTAITIATDESDHQVTLSYPEMPFVGIWSPTPKEAPFVCIEPWCGIADAVDATGQLAEKFGINKLPANELFKTQYMISVK